VLNLIEYLETDKDKNLVELVSWNLESFVEGMSNTEVKHNEYPVEHNQSCMFPLAAAPPGYQVVTPLIGQPVNYPE